MKKVLLSIIVGLSAMLSANALTYTVTVPEGTNTVYICGNMTGWAHLEMTKIDDLQYSITIDGASTSDPYKYCSGPAWSYVEKDEFGEEIGDRSWQEADVVATWAMVYVPDLGSRDVTLTVTVPAGTLAVYVNGTMNGWSGFDALTKTTETQYTITYTGITDPEVQYKYSSGPDWAYEELTADGGPVANRKSESDNINDEVAQWREVYGPTGIAEIVAEKGAAIDFEVYSVLGAQLPKDAKGLLIVKYVFEDGSSYSVKEVR